MSKNPGLNAQEVTFLKWGRHFRLPGGSKLIVGRDEKENKIISSLARPSDNILTVEDVPGPTSIMTGSDPADIELAASITVSYSDAEDNQPYRVILRIHGKKKLIQVRGRPKADFAHLMVN